MHVEGRKRVVIENVKPEIDCGRFPIKRIAGERVEVTADIFADGHDTISAKLLYRCSGNNAWEEVPMNFIENDRWKGTFIVKELGIYHYTLKAWINQYHTWQKMLRKKLDAGQDITADLLMGIDLLVRTAKRASENDRIRLREFIHSLKESNREKACAVAISDELTELMDTYQDTEFATTYGKELQVIVDREKALFSTWYERFPRSCATEPGRHGTFKDCEKILPEIARMGFDVFYLPPIHPIGKTHRKGKNNSPVCERDDAGSPWAIGSKEGGHKSIHPQLGTFEDFGHLIKTAKGYGIEIALDLAFQCSPDHPFVTEHPEWFRWRPDGTIQYAENPPKKYEDIVPLHFETEHWNDLWEELKGIIIFWIEKGIRIFRVDNPHTKPFQFWEWLIKESKNKYPDVIFLAEAFTRPKVMYYLAKLGFTQSYTYFTWRNTKREFIDYLTELTQTEVKEFFRPNFWPNTPDILPEHLQYGGRPAFMSRLVLAATLSSNYGMYGPPFELCINEALPGKEEYLNAEKYEIKQWEWDTPGNLKDLISRVNRLRKENPALQSTSNVRFYEVDNDYLLFYGKATEDLSNIILVVVNLDPFHTQSGWVKVPLSELGIDLNQPYLVHDLLSDDKYIWQGESNYVELNPHLLPAHILKVRKRLKKEADFDYFM
ncbi:MAG TPA: alpha-1,4-glucan--maltose-1-phosphate maltosyltransferase [Thermodesulfobacteriota bacterium]|nr:alpha-1,4-glucan--maltose-1-phosphate maltosyltransferase [Thermodesulfobacteriota bacterium]